MTRPVGWWLKEADRRLDAAFDAALAGSGVSRRGWQVLTMLSGEPLPQSEVVDALAAFDEPAVVNSVVDGLVRAGWIRSGDVLTLTPAGAETRRLLAGDVDAVRARVTAALGDDYPTLIALLGRLVDGFPA